MFLANTLLNRKTLGTCLRRSNRPCHCTGTHSYPSRVRNHSWSDTQEARRIYASTNLHVWSWKRHSTGPAAWTAGATREKPTWRGSARMSQRLLRSDFIFSIHFWFSVRRLDRTQEYVQKTYKRKRMFKRMIGERATHRVAIIMAL